MAGYVLDGFGVYTQKYIGKTITNNLFKKAPLFAALVGIGGNQQNTDMKIARPGSAEVFSGAKLNKVRKEVLSGINAYAPPILTAKIDNNKNMGVRDTMPTVANATTSSHDQAYAAPSFHWTNKTEPILVWNTTLNRAMTTAGTGLDNRDKAIKNVLQNAADLALQNHIDKWATSFWSGSPTNQATDSWDDACGITVALSGTNTYGNVDRGVTGTTAWQSWVINITSPSNDPDGNSVAAFSGDIATLIDTANLTYQCGIVGNGINLVLTTPSLYKGFKAQVRAKGGQVLFNGMPEMGQFGFKRECLQYDNTYIMYDPFCPSGDVAMLNLDTWLAILSKEHNFTVSEFIDLKKYAEAAKDAKQAYIETDMIFACNNPRVNLLYTNVT